MNCDNFRIEMSNIASEYICLKYFGVEVLNFGCEGNYILEVDDCIVTFGAVDDG